VKRSLSERAFDIFNVLLMLILSFMFLYPFLYVVFASFSNPELLVKHKGLLLLPEGFTLQGYTFVFRNPNIYSGYLNTIYYVVVGTLYNMVMTCLGAYVLSRKDWLLKTPMMVMITFTMFFSGGLIPSFILVKNLGMMNTRAALIIPGAISTYNMIIMRTSFMQIPSGLEESAKLDGANDLQILWHVVLPVSKAVLAVITLFYAVGHWNSWFNASIYLRKRELFPLQLILREILIENNTSAMLDNASAQTLQDLATNKAWYKELVQYSTIVVSTVPILFIYPFVQKYFVKGVMIGSIKG